MRVKNFNRIIAWLMLYLIISITFASSFALATIYKAEAYGQDQASGYMRENDNLVIKTESTMPCSVSGEFTQDLYKQMSCGSGLPVSCAYTAKITNITSMISVSVKEASSGETKALDVYVDNIPPKINALTTASIGNGVKASYTLADQANADNTGNCSGIRKVELFLNNQLVNSTNYTVGVCNIRGAVTGSIPNYIGNVNTSIKVYDYVGLTANKTGSQVFIDTKPPQIKTVAKVYRTGTDEEVKIVSTNGTKSRAVDVLVQIDENALEASNSVFGNFSMLDKTNSSDQSSVEASCDREGWNQTYDCKFTGIKLLPAVANPKIIINATDQAGNSANATISLVFTVVNNAGTVIKMGPEAARCISGICYVKPGTNNITAEISSSSTFNESNIFIQGTRATCEKVSSWICQADANIQASDNYILLTGTDDLGNEIKGKSNITVDSAPPQVLNVNLHATNNQSLDNLRKADVIVINVTVTDTTPITAIADLSGLGDASKNATPGNCQGANTTKQCTWTATVQLDYYAVVSLPITFKDASGQTTTITPQVTVKEKVQEVPDLWNTKVDYNPKRINNRLLVYYSKEVFSYITLEKKQATAKIRKVDLLACASNQTTGETLPTLTPKLISLSSDKENIVTSVEIPSGNYTASTLQWNCYLSLTTDTATAYYNAPEVENYTLKITLDSSQLMSDHVINETQRIREELNQDWPKLIRNADKILGTITSICSAMKSIDTLTNGCALQEILSLPDTVKVPARKCTESSVAGSSKLIGKTLGKVCSFLSCEQEGFVGLMSKWSGTEKIADIIAIPAQAAGLDPGGVLSKGTPEEKKQAVQTVFASSLNPQESFAASIIMLCPSGIIYNLKKQQILECEKLSCLENDVPAGLPPTECEKNYKYNQCVYVTGQWMSLPFIDVADYITSQIKEIISDPIAMGGMILSMLGCKILPGVTPHGICVVPFAVSKLASITRIVAAGKDILQRLKSFTNPTTGASQQPDDVCSQITQRSAYLDLPYDIRTGKITGCVPNVGCPDKEAEGKLVDLKGISRPVITGADVNVNALRVPTRSNTATKLEDLRRISNTLNNIPVWAQGLISEKDKKTIKDEISKLEEQLAKEQPKEQGKTQAEEKTPEQAKAEQERKQQSVAEEYYNQFAPAGFKANPELRNDYFIYSQLSSVNCKDGKCTVPSDLVNLVQGINKGEISAEQKALLMTMFKDYGGDEKSILAKIAAISNLQEFFNAISTCKEPCTIDEKSDSMKHIKAALEKSQNNIWAEISQAWWGGKSAISWQQFRSGMAIARGIHTLSATLGLPDKIFRSWNRGVNEALNSLFIFNLKSNLVRGMCEDNLNVPGASRGMIANINAQGNLYTAAHVEAEAEKIINYSKTPPEDTGKYKYVITAGVTNAHPSKSLNFTILIDNSFVVLNMTKLESNHSFSLGNGRGVILNETNKYSTVCINFVEDVYQYFDTVIDLVADNKLCNDIIFYNASAS